MSSESGPKVSQEKLSIPKVESKPKRGLNLVWLVPIIATLVGLGLAVKAVMDRGPQVTLQFATADGLEAGKTKIKYKDVEIGLVKSLTLSKDQKTVIVTTDFIRDAEPLLVEDTRFWVVRPRIGLEGVSGLGTLLSGAYIGLDVGKSKAEKRHYVGLEEPPLIASNRPGKEFILKADDLGSIDVGSPIYLRRVRVGRVVSHVLDQDGRGITMNIFVDSPYDKFVNPYTRFYHTSGINLQLDDRGFKLNVESMAALASGGIAFTTQRRYLEEEPAAAKAEFALHSDEQTAMRLPDGVAQSYAFIFNESIRGLRVGSTVDFRGLPIGEVTSISVDYGEQGKSVSMVVEADIYHSRLARRMIGNAKAPLNDAQRRMTMDRLVGTGLRAQMRSGSLVTGEQYIALDFFPKATPAKIDWKHSAAVVPTQPGKLASIEEELTAALDAVKATLASVEKLAQRIEKEVTPELTQTLTDVRGTLAVANKLLASEAPVQQELRETLREVAKAAASLRLLTEMLEKQPESLIQGKKGDGQ